MYSAKVSGFVQAACSHYRVLLLLLVQDQPLTVGNEEDSGDAPVNLWEHWNLKFEFLLFMPQMFLIAFH